ncbi:MAG: ornithine cyclodeaminase/alanine dehydrogenase-like protein (mu-crystallin family) [Cryomorphaceae bacterium]|jgi:ornithine cyclodeaminase/alanine dehydrogenase-like protein (mu-crystallin family)
MLYLNLEQTVTALPWHELIEALERGFKQGCDAPARHQHQFKISGEQDGSLLLMPAWISGSFIGVKQVLVVPENGTRGLPAVNASYQLSCAKTGQLLAIMDGEALTHRRTAAASALASRFLSRPDSEHLLMVGTGGMARSLIPAHCSQRPIKSISIWGRNFDKSKKLADEITHMGYPVQAVRDLASSAANADIISCATLAHKPLIKAEWLAPGTHIDLVGSFTPSMREADSATMSTSSVFVDTYAGALEEAGDLLIAIEEEVFMAKDICASLEELCRHQHQGRVTDTEITVFKSVGTALEDLMAAILVYQSSAKSCIPYD